MDGVEPKLNHWNSASTRQISLSLFGQSLVLQQDPNSGEHGTTVWDASLVFAKFAEFNAKKFGPAMHGKRVLELGAGCGLSSLAMLIRGADVTSTDLASITPLLAANVERNLRTIAGNTDRPRLGASTVFEWDWTRDPVGEFNPPYDMVIATDCVFSMALVNDLVRCIESCCHARTEVYICHEIRDETINDAFKEALQQKFTVKKINPSKLHPDYRHELVEMLHARPLNAAKLAAVATTTVDKA